MRRVALFIGAVGGAAWMGLAFYPPECRPPTEISEDFCARLWTPALAAMLVGFSALFAPIRRSAPKPERIAFAALLVGLALVTLGNFVEYWFLSDLPHEGPDGWSRGVAFMAVLSGFFAVLIGALVFGIATLRRGRGARVLGVSFAAALPLTVAFAVAAPSLVGVPLGALSVAAAGLGVVSDTT